jgi:NAD(P)-dependent dehydrogenase (short-subunit alcohol dehydrogenase family)
MVDVAESRAVTALVESVLARYGQIDVLVNNAAITHPMQPIVDISDDVIDHVFAVNVRGTIACSRAVGRAMCARGSGRIINIASQLGKAPWPGHAVYSASKAAVIALTQASALELAPNGVIVNCICPGTLVTDQMRATFADKARASGRDVNELIDEAAKAMPLGRMGKPEDVAALVAWLASEEASFIVGAAINLTGGESVAL